MAEKIACAPRFCSKNFIRHIFETLFVTMWLAGTLLIAEDSGWLDGLDNLMFAHAVNSADDTASVPVTKGDVLVVKISRTFYETEFRERSPLDPRLLDPVIKAIAASQPRQLAVDIDLSPSPSDSDLPGAEIARETMIERLKLLASQSVRVLLVLPATSVTPAEQARKAKWAGSICNAGIDLADPNLGLSYTPAGISLLKYVSTFDSLGVMMGRPDSRGLCGSLNAEGSLPSLLMAPSNAATALMNGSESQDRKRINFKAFDDTEVVVISTSNDVDTLHEKLQSAIMKTVVLAGDFDERDNFLLPNGRTVSGAEVHAAQAYSESNPVNASHVWAYVMDIFFGVFVGLVLHSLWAIYGKTKFLYVRALCLFGATAAIALPAYLLVVFMPTLLRLDLWVNAIPLFIGLYIHGAMEPLHAAHQSDESKDSRCRPCFKLVGWRVANWQPRLDDALSIAWFLIRWALLLTGVWLIIRSLAH